MGNEEKTGGACSWVLNHRGGLMVMASIPRCFMSIQCFFLPRFYFSFFLFENSSPILPFCQRQFEFSFCRWQAKEPKQAMEESCES